MILPGQFVGMRCLCVLSELHAEQPDACAPNKLSMRDTCMLSPFFQKDEISHPHTVSLVPLLPLTPPIPIIVEYVQQILGRLRRPSCSDQLDVRTVRAHLDSKRDRG